MEIIADLHIHSKYSRATSKNLSIENLEKYARIKGVGLFGTGDFQHPLHRKDIEKDLIENDKGILRTKTGFPFIWQTEISLMFSQGGKGRAVHLLVFAPNSQVANKITNYLKSKGRIDYDGRPIFGIPCKDFVKDLKQIDDKVEIIPAHCLTSWFGIFGSKSGFDSIEECFQDQARHIYAIESGMSASPEMLWRLKEKVNIVSFSDAHAHWPFRIGREATIFDIHELTYDNLIKAIRTGIGLSGTIETPPEYGKYHWDGHRNCNFSCDYLASEKLEKKCPVCNTPLTIGVEYRIEKLAKEPNNFKPENAKTFHKILPLHELIALNMESRIESKKTWEAYDGIIEKFESEFKILLDIPKEDLLKKEINEKLVELILFNRKGKLQVKPGFDGEYGKVLLPESQIKLF